MKRIIEAQANALESLLKIIVIRNSYFLLTNTNYNDPLNPRIIIC
jgi:hypothetical protein